MRVVEFREGVRVGIAGAGIFGGYHAWKVFDHPNAVLSAIFDMNAAVGKSLADKFKTAATTDQVDFLAQIDAVIVTLPATQHAQFVLAALNAGKHVFVEKPIATTLQDADQMIAIADKQALILQVGHQERFVAKALGLLDLPTHPSEIISVRAMPSTGRGQDVSAVLDMMIHDLDLVAWYLNGDSYSVEKVGDAASADEGCIKIFSSSGVVNAECRVSRVSESRERSLVLKFDEGEIALDFLTRAIHNTTGFSLKENFSEESDVAKQSLALRDPLAFGFDQFVSSITKKLPAIISARDGRTALALALDVEDALGIRACDVDQKGVLTQSQSRTQVYQ